MTALFASSALGGRTHSLPHDFFGSKTHCSPSRSHSGVAAHGPAHRHNYDELAVRAHDEQRRISFFICLTRRAIARRDAQSTRRWASRRSRHVGVVAHGPAHLYNYDELAVRAHEQRRISFFIYLTRRAMGIALGRRGDLATSASSQMGALICTHGGFARRVAAVASSLCTSSC